MTVTSPEGPFVYLINNFLSCFKDYYNIFSFCLPSNLLFSHFILKVCIRTLGEFEYDSGKNSCHSPLSQLHLERPKLYTILAFLSAVGLRCMGTLSGEAILPFYFCLTSQFGIALNGKNRLT